MPPRFPLSPSRHTGAHRGHLAQCDAAPAPSDRATAAATGDGAASAYPPLRVQGGRLLVPVRVVPRAAHVSVRLEAGEVAIHLTAPPVDGAANDALIALLAARLHTPRHAIAVARGGRARHKLVAIEGLDADEFWRRLAL
jgi:uncharacterized protein YggU (UPF0235/DUF167 family)